MTGVAFYVLTASALAWIYLAFFHHRFWRSDITLPQTAGEVKNWPHVVAVIPARNEDKVLGRALRSLNEQEYPGFFDIIVVDDNSTDETAATARAVLGVTVVDGRPLAPGWAGKLWAMYQGIGVAEKKFPAAEFYWFTDADICHGPGVLKGLVEAAALDRRDMISQMVSLHCKSFWEKAFIPAFIFFFEMLYPFGAINSNSSRVSGAAGGCILLKTKWLKRIGGIEAIKNALIDDCEMAKAVKGQGGQIWLGLGLESQSIRPYTFQDFWTTVARTAFTQLRNSTLLLFGALLAMALVFLAPPFLAAGGLLWGNNSLAGAAIILWAVIALLYLPTQRLYGLNPVRGVFLPFVAALYMAMTVHSAIRHWLGRGGVWKDRSYDFKD